MGIKAVSAGTLWTVQSVSGAAARAGVRAGDVIESVNGGNLKIRRDGKTVLVVVGR
jgi:S1-C subfamily serine protease